MSATFFDFAIDNGASGSERFPVEASRKNDFREGTCRRQAASMSEPEWASYAATERKSFYTAVHAGTGNKFGSRGEVKIMYYDVINKLDYL